MIDDNGTRLNSTPLYKWINFHHRLLGRYGAEFIHDLLVLKNTPGWSMTDVGKKYGVTREYIRQVFYQYFGYYYTECIKQKRDMVKNDIAPCVHDPKYKVAEYKKGSLIKRGAVIELKFREICEAMGFDIKNSCSPTTDIIVNGYKVEIKSTTRPYKYYPGSKSSSYKWSIRADQIKENDYFALYRPDIDKFIIVPNELKQNGKNKSIYMSVDKTDHHASKNRYWDNIDRFDLLELKN